MSERLRTGQISVRDHNAGEYVQGGKRRMRLFCSVMLPNHDSPTQFSVTAALAKSVKPGGRAWRAQEEELRRKGEARAKKMLLDAHDELKRAASLRPGHRLWRMGDKAADYIREVSMPAIERRTGIREHTRQAYLEGMRGVLGLVGPELTLDDLTHQRTLESLLRRSADEHGTQTAKRHMNLLKNYVVNLPA